MPIAMPALPSLDYAIYLAADGWVYILENGVSRGQFVPYASSDKFRIERSADGHVVYEKNGVTFYTSSVVSTAALRADSTLYTPGATLQGVVLSAAGAPPTPVQWVNATGVEVGHLAQNVKTSFADVNGDGRMDAVQMASDVVSGFARDRRDGTLGATIAPGAVIDGLNDLRKTSGTSGWDSGASSSQSFTGAGYAQTVLAETNTHRMFGLSDADTDASTLSLDYAVFVRADGLLDVYEGGAFRGEFTTYTTGDTLRIERLANGQVVYKKNGTVFYTSTIVSMAELHVDTSFYSPGATLEDVVLSVNGGAAKAVQWENETGIAVGTWA